MGLFFNRWSIKKSERELQVLPNVYDVRVEEPMKGRYLVHVFMTDLNAGIQHEFAEAAKKIFRRRPRRVKVDVLLYKMAPGLGG